jgi:hypothetical protein
VNGFRASSVDRGLDEEIAFHIDCRINELVEAGMNREEAETMARRQFGNLKSGLRASSGTTAITFAARWSWPKRRSPSSSSSARDFPGIHRASALTALPLDRPVRVFMVISSTLYATKTFARHSVRSATTGSTREARRAGI